MAQRYGRLKNVSPTGILAIIQGVFDPNKSSGVGINFRLLVHVLPGPNKLRV
jgi:hypothetical protein